MMMGIGELSVWFPGRWFCFCLFLFCASCSLGRDGMYHIYRSAAKMVVAHHSSPSINPSRKPLPAFPMKALLS
ncbi:hypothetical protein HOY80DRAFT_967775 [Tuber brumale]|nr:hypothetical protein HOY80DRAFT_967775 [Tuber brumale]